MTDPQVAVVRDRDGRQHFASRYSKFVVDGLADGSLLEIGPDGEPIERNAIAEEPPRGGAGSGVEAWRKFASSEGVAVNDDMTRDDIIAAVDAAKEAASEAQPSESGDHPDAGTASRGSGDRQSDSRPADDSARGAGTTQSGSGS